MKQHKYIDEDTVKKFLKSWIKGVIEIGQSHASGKNYEVVASLFLSKHYAFDESDVLFKPTFTRNVIFRNTKEEALSYFIKGNIAEDDGFAIRPWKTIEALEVHTNIEENFSIAMGILELCPCNDNKLTRIAFTFVMEVFNASLKIRAHHSSPIIY